METTQLSLRLPNSLVRRIEECVARIRHHSGLDVTRADVMRMLLSHAVDVCSGDVRRLFKRNDP